MEKVKTDLWNSGDFRITCQIRERSDSVILTEKGEIEEKEGGKPHLEISVEDAESGTPIPGVEVEAVIKKDGQNISDSVDVPFLFGPEEAVYAESVEIREGNYDILVKINNGEKGEVLELEFEQLSYFS